MKKAITLLLLCAMMCTASLAMAAGVTLRTFTPFADMDFAAQGFMDLITAWETETGNFVEDYSGSMDEAWMAQLTEMANAGGADVVVLPVGSGLTGAQLVTAAELMGAAPQLNAKVLSSMAEADGSVLLTPVRVNWEGLYINTEILGKYGLSIPSSLEELVEVCASLSAEGILPIANALGDWAEIALDCLALSGAPTAAYGSAASFDGARDTVIMLALVGAFGSDPLAATDEETMDGFLAGEAAMRFDSDFLAYDISSSLADVVTVIKPPARGGVMTSSIVGTPGFGLAITRSCFADEEKREAAISLCERMLANEALVSPVGGLLGQGIMQLTREGNECTGLLYDANPEGFDAWSAEVVSSLKK